MSAPIRTSGDETKTDRSAEIPCETSFVFTCRHSGVIEIRETTRGNYCCETCGALVLRKL